MLNPASFYNELQKREIEFFCGVPDSLLKDICAYITDNVPANKHIITANEGNAVALAAGYHMATEKIPVVYMQNSGLGNTVNPLLSLSDEKVYQIPLLLLIGWRGEPGVKDEPQHNTQGEVTIDLLKAMKIPHEILSLNPEEFKDQLDSVISKVQKTNQPVALLVRKGTFEKYSIKNSIKPTHSLLREDAIKTIVDCLEETDVIVSTTGKTSRELFEYRKALGHPHHSDFLTVGSMGHSSQIALGIALSKPNANIVCLDGDGALLMHTGGMAIIGDQEPANLLHIVINNGAHESVGGQPTVGFKTDFISMAKASRYKNAQSVSSIKEITNALVQLKGNGPSLLEIKVNVGSRDDLGRPTIKPVDNKIDFMQNLKKL